MFGTLIMAMFGIVIFVCMWPIPTILGCVLFTVLAPAVVWSNRTVREIERGE